jgi:hypothetical protein
VTTREAGTFTGQLVEMDPAAYAASQSAQACDAGSHTAVWEMNVKSTSGTSLAVPIAIDQVASGHQLTMCFDDERAQNLTVAGVDFYRNDGLTSPVRLGRYVLDAIVTPFAADGSPDPSSAYELRAYEILPRALSAASTYNPATHVLTVTGVLTYQRKPSSRVPIDVSAGTSRAGLLPTVGYTRTAAGGKYTFRKKLARAPRYAYAEVDDYEYSSCPGSSPAPAGCLSYSLDGVLSATIRVRVRAARH